MVFCNIQPYHLRYPFLFQLCALFFYVYKLLCLISSYHSALCMCEFLTVRQGKRLIDYGCNSIVLPQVISSSRCYVLTPGSVTKVLECCLLVLTRLLCNFLSASLFIRLNGL